MKTFEPEITPGPWEILGPNEEGRYHITVNPDPDKKYEDFILNAGDGIAYDIKNYGDAKAICAVPEMRDVYKAAVSLVEHLYEFDEIVSQEYVEVLQEKINKLEEMHGVES